MAPLNTKEKEAYKYFFQAYSRLKDLNEPYRNNFDEFDEYYRGYRNNNKYPFAYNYSFNKLIPIIMTVLSRIMGHLYRNSDVVVVRPRKSKDVRRSDYVAGLLNYQLNNLNDIDFQGGSYMVMLQWFLSALVFGKGITKCYWRKEERTAPKRLEVNIPIIQRGPNGMPFLAGYDPREYITNELQTIYDGPYVENIPVRNFLPDPEYRSIQKMPCVGHLYRKSFDWLKEMEARGVFKNISEVGKINERIQSGGSDIESFMQTIKDIEGAITLEEIQTDKHKASNIDMIDLHGKYALGGPQVDVDNGITWKGKEEECICTIANYDTVVRLEKSMYGVKPFFDIGAHINMHRYWDIGFIELCKDIQEVYNNISNLRLQNAMMKVNTMIKVLEDSEIDPRALVWKPFGIIPVSQMDEVETLDTPDYSSAVFQEQINFFDRTIQDMSGIYDYSKGVTPERHEAVGTIYSIQSVGESRIRLLLMTMDYMGIRPLLKYMMTLNTYHLPSGFEFRIMGQNREDTFGRVFGSDLHIDYDFEAKYAAMEPALAKEARAAQLLQYAQIWQQDPSINHYQFKKAILELMDFPQADRFLRNPQEIMMMQQQEEQKQVSARIGEMAFQKKLQDDNNQIELAKALLK